MKDASFHSSSLLTQPSLKIKSASLTLHAFIGNYLEPLAYLVYLIAVSLYAKEHREKNPQLLLLYFTLAFACMLSSTILVEIKAPETIWLYNIHAFFTVWILGVYFRNLFQSSFKKNIATFLIVSVTAYLLVKNLVLHQFHTFDSIGYSLVSASVVLYVFLYFHQLLSNVTDENIFHNFNFWLTSGFLIYFLGNFIIFLSYHYFTAKIMATYTQEERYILTNLWGLHNCLLFVGAASLLSGSLWMAYRRKSVLS